MLLDHKLVCDAVLVSSFPLKLIPVTKIPHLATKLNDQNLKRDGNISLKMKKALSQKCSNVLVKGN